MLGTRASPMRRTGIKRTSIVRKVIDRAVRPDKHRAPAKKRPSKTAAEKRHHGRIAAMGCLVCDQPATVHHVTASIHGGRITRTHKRVTPLCPRHHMQQFGPHESVEALNHGGFHERYGIDLLQAADVLWALSQAEEARR